MAEEQAQPASEEAPPESQNAVNTGGEGAPNEAGAEGGGDAAREQRYSKQFHALDRKRKAFAQERAEWEQTRAQRDAEYQQFQQQQQALHRAREMAAQNPEEWLKQGRIDKNRVDEYYKQREGQPPHDARFDKIAELERAIRERDERFERLEKMQAQHNESVYVDKVEREVRAAGEEFELVNHFGAHRDVAAYQALYRQKTGEWLPTKAAAQEIENLLLEQREAEIRKGLASQKLAKRLGWQPNTNQPGTEEAKPAEAKAPEKITSTKRPLATERKRPPLDPTLTNDQRWEKMKERWS